VGRPGRLFVPFLSGILVHFIRFRLGIGQGRAGKMFFDQFLNRMTPFQQVRAVNAQFFGQVFCRCPLDDAAYDENDGDTRVAASAPNGISEDIVHIAAYSTLVVKDRVSVSVMGSLIRRQGMTIAAM